MMNPRSNQLISDLDQARLYAWNDPLLDREVFEARLLAEPHLADLVVNAVEETIVIRAVLSECDSVRSVNIPSPPQFARRESPYFVNAALILSIAVAVAIVFVPARWFYQPEPKGPSLSLAQIWSDLHTQTSAISGVETLELIIESEEEFGDDFIQNEDGMDRELPDWLIAATAYGTTDRGSMP